MKLDADGLAEPIAVRVDDENVIEAALVCPMSALALYEGERRLPFSIIAVRASIPSDRSFAEYDTALAHFGAAPLPEGLDLPWQQALCVKSWAERLNRF